jgi:hypothetical protein
VIATGRISTYADRSKYQFVIERLEYAGEGALLKRIEALRAKFLAEGLFDAARKRPIPLLPRVVGVVTSEGGAVIHDIRTTLARRFPRHVILWPVQVQGEDAARQVAAAIRGFSALLVGGPIPRPDVLIVARGGGSVEDLMAFNEEGVVRAAAESSIPLISAIGHETDTTLIDFASDRRAPTPTAAAEMAVPARAEIAAALAQSGAASPSSPTARSARRGCTSPAPSAACPTCPACSTACASAGRPRRPAGRGAARLPVGQARPADGRRRRPAPPARGDRRGAGAAGRAGPAPRRRAGARPAGAGDGPGPGAACPSPPWRPCCARRGCGWTGWRRGSKLPPHPGRLARGFVLVRAGRQAGDPRGA